MAQLPPTSPPDRSPKHGIVVGVTIAIVFVLMLAGLSVAVFGTDKLFRRSVAESKAPDSVPSPSLVTGRDVVPRRALRDTIMLTNSKGCGEGSIRHLAWAAQTTARDALMLLPNEGSLPSFSLPDTTPVYDIMLTGRCQMAGRSYTTIEALVFARPGQFPTVGVAGMEERTQLDPNSPKPFGDQWNN
jgi:hypothetical protein